MNVFYVCLFYVLAIVCQDSWCETNKLSKCDSIPDDFLGTWYTTHMKDRTINIHSNDYVAEGERVQTDPFLKINEPTEPYEILCGSNPSRLLMKAQVGGNERSGIFYQCLQLKKVSETIMEAKVVYQSFLKDQHESMDCHTKEKISGTRVYFEFLMTSDHIPERILQAPNKLGCFKLIYNRDHIQSAGYLVYTNFLNVERCSIICSFKRYPYMYLISPNECWCSFLFASAAGDPANKTKAATEDCNFQCSGSTKYQNCGGPNHASVYQIQGLQPAEAPKQDYLGCYENKEGTDMSEVTIFSEHMTIYMCIDHCANHQYLYCGTTQKYQRESLCSCGNSLGILKEMNSRNCDSPCLGDESTYCRGTHKKMSVYRTTGLYKARFKCDAIPRTFHGEWYTASPQEQRLEVDSLLYKSIAAELVGGPFVLNCQDVKPFEIQCVGHTVVRFKSVLESQDQSSNLTYQCVQLEWLSNTLNAVVVTEVLPENTPKEEVDCDSRAADGEKRFYNQIFLTRKPDTTTPVKCPFQLQSSEIEEAEESGSGTDDQLQCEALGICQTASLDDDWSEKEDADSVNYSLVLSAAGGGTLLCIIIIICIVIKCTRSKKNSDAASCTSKDESDVRSCLSEESDIVNCPSDCSGEIRIGNQGKLYGSEMGSTGGISYHGPTSSVTQATAGFHYYEPANTTAFQNTASYSWGEEWWTQENHHHLSPQGRYSET